MLDLSDADIENEEVPQVMLQWVGNTQRGKGTANDDTDKGDSCKEFPVVER